MEARGGRRIAAMALAVSLALAGCGSQEDDESVDTGADESEETEDTTAADGQDGLEDLDAITFVVPWDAGGGFDVTTRIVAECIPDAALEIAGADISAGVENVSGAQGKIGNRDVYGAEPDGSRLLMNAVDIMVPQQVLEDDAIATDELTPVAQFIRAGRSLIVTEQFIDSSATFEDVLDRAQEIPILFGGAGLENQIELMLALLEDNGTPMPVDLVQFEGTGDAVAAMLRGDLEMYLVTDDAAQDAAQSNPEIRVLAKLDDLPVDAAADISTVAGTNVRGIFGPPDMSEERAATLGQVFERAVDDCRSQLEDAGHTDVYDERAELAAVTNRMVEIYETYKDRLE